MILKYFTNKIRTLHKPNHFLFAKQVKKKTQAPKRVPTKNLFDPNNVNYSMVPQDLKKGVKAHVQVSNIQVASESQIEAAALRQVILQERQKMKQTIQSYGKIKSKEQEQKQKLYKSQNLIHEKPYDIMRALRLLLATNNFIGAISIGGCGAMFAMHKFEHLGFFLGSFINPSLMTAAGITIGFNCASWIMRHSLHLDHKNQKTFTVDKINLTSCGYMMQLNALGIALQTFSLGYYMMSPVPFLSIQWLAFALIIAQSQLVINCMKITNGNKFEYISRVLYTQLVSVSILAFITYYLFKQVQQSKQIKTLQQAQKMNNNQKQKFFKAVEIRIGYQYFLSIFKNSKFEVIAGETINKLVIQL